MTNTKKMTKRNYFEILRASYPTDAENYADVIAFIDHELELLERKNSAEKKPTAMQVANKAVQEVILDCMEQDTLYTITDMIKAFPVLADMTNQKVSALVRQLVENGSVEKVVDKRKSYFRLA